MLQLRADDEKAARAGLKAVEVFEDERRELDDAGCVRGGDAWPRVDSIPWALLWRQAKVAGTGRKRRATLSIWFRLQPTPPLPVAIYTVTARSHTLHSYCATSHSAASAQSLRFMAKPHAENANMLFYSMQTQRLL